MKTLDERKIFAKLPAWYKRHWASVPRKSFEPDLSVRYPSGLTTRMTPAIVNCPRWDETMTPQQYVERFDIANGLKPTRIEWVTPTLGSFG